MRLSPNPLRFSQARFENNIQPGVNFPPNVEDAIQNHIDTIESAAPELPEGVVKIQGDAVELKTHFLSATGGIHGGTIHPDRMTPDDISEATGEIINRMPGN